MKKIILILLAVLLLSSCNPDFIFGTSSYKSKPISEAVTISYLGTDITTSYESEYGTITPPKGYVFCKIGFQFESKIPSQVLDVKGRYVTVLLWTPDTGNVEAIIEPEEHVLPYEVKNVYYVFLVKEGYEITNGNVYFFPLVLDGFENEVTIPIDDPA